jgi:hypothetical protein
MLAKIIDRAAAIKAGATPPAPAAARAPRKKTAKPTKSTKTTQKKTAAKRRIK